MNAQTAAYGSYATLSSTKSTKDMEIEIILKTTRELKSSEQMREADYAQFAMALSKNRRLWTLFLTDVAMPGNGLPAELKARIFHLGEFVQNYSGRVLRENLSIAPLLDVNLALLRGLSAPRSDG